MGYKDVNYGDRYDGISVKVMCPKCGAGGATWLNNSQPKCHVCKYTTLMEPASNNKIECTWSEAQAYHEELKDLYRKINGHRK